MRLRSDRLESVRRIGKPENAYRKLTFHKNHLEEDQHLDAILLGPGHSLYSAVDERLNEKLAPLIGGIAETASLRWAFAALVPVLLVVPLLAPYFRVAPHDVPDEVVGGAVAT